MNFTNTKRSQAQSIVDFYKKKNSYDKKEKAPFAKGLNHTNIFSRNLDNVDACFMFEFFNELLLH